MCVFIFSISILTLELPNSHIFVTPKKRDYLGMCDCSDTLWLFGYLERFTSKVTILVLFLFYSSIPVLHNFSKLIKYSNFREAKLGCVTIHILVCVTIRDVTNHIWVCVTIRDVTIWRLYSIYSNDWWSHLFKNFFRWRWRC